MIMRLLTGQAVLLLLLAALAAVWLPAAASEVRQAAGPEASDRPRAAGAPLQRPNLAGKRFSSAAGNLNTPEGGTESSGWYFYYEIIEVELTVSETVTVQGFPQLELTIGSATRKAGYHSGSGSAKLYFQYRVQTGDYDANGIAIPQNALKLNGGRITGASGALLLGEFSSPTQLGHAPRHKVDGAKGHSHPRYVSVAGTDQVYDIGAPIPDLMLPAATGGNGPLAYSAHLNPVRLCGAAGGSSPSGGSGGVGGSSSVNLRDWMIFTPPGPGDTHGGKISAAPGDTPNTFKAPTAGLHGCLTITVQDSDDDTGDRDRHHHTLSITVKFDYDSDNNGLIEVSRLSQLDAIRYDLNGDGAQGAVSADDWAKYAAAFPDAMPGMGCPDTAADTDTEPGPCAGYELTASLDFDTDKDGATYTETGGILTGDAGDAYYNGGAGWNPIGTGANPFTATLDGRGHTIANLFIRWQDSATADQSAHGLFANIGGRVENLGMLNVRISVSRNPGKDGEKTHTFVAPLSARNFGEVSGSYATGAVSVFVLPGVSDQEGPLLNVGGLIGKNHNTGTMAGSYAAVSVAAAGRADTPRNDTLKVGGLVGGNDGEITAAYATGAIKVTHGSFTGGLTGQNRGEITASYAVGLVTAADSVGGLAGTGAGSAADSYWDTGTTGQSASKVGLAKTTRQLQTPTGYTGLYANWNLDLDGDAATGDAAGKDDPWDFGTSHQYPVLKYGGLSVAQQRRNFLEADNWNAPAVGDPALASADAPAAAWQWQRETGGVWSNITGATSSSYVPTAADGGQRLRAVATYTEGGITRTFATANTGAVAAAPPATASIAQLTPTVGSAALRHQFDPTAGITSADAHRWRWLRCDTAEMTGSSCIVAASSAKGAVAASYTPAAADVGKYLQAQIYYTANDDAKTWTRTQGPVVGPVIAAASPPSGPSGS